MKTLYKQVVYQFLGKPPSTHPPKGLPGSTSRYLRSTALRDPTGEGRAVFRLAWVAIEVG